jgi:hypothetical protein
MHKKSFDKDALLWEAIDMGLSGLGAPVKSTVLWHLNNRGRYLGRKECDIRELYSALQELLGSGVDVVFNDVYANLRKLIADDYVAGRAAKSCPDCPVNKIERLLGMGEPQE